MKKLLNPAWIFIVVTLPHLALFAIYGAAYGIIHSLLREHHLHNWFLFGGMLAALGGLATLYAVLSLYRRRSVNPLFGFFLLAAYIPYLFLFGERFSSIVPWTVPRWMLFHGDLFLAVLTCLMPALIYGLMLVVAKFTADGKEHRAWMNFAGAVAVPLTWYALFASKALYAVERFLDEVLPFIFILSTLAFLFLLLRALFILLASRSQTMKKYRSLWVIPVSFIFPLLGLAVHGGLLRGVEVPRGPFGDFSHPAFYLLAALNGVILSLPAPGALRPRFAMAAARAFTLPFTVYFFLVFLPYFPLSVIAVIVAGAGFLMLTPLVLLPLHVHALHRDFEWLRERLPVRRLAALLCVAFFILPSMTAGVFLRDRFVLHRTLEYVYEPDYSGPEVPDIDRSSIGRVLKTVRNNNEQGRWDDVGGRTPYLTPLYQYIVLDSLTLSRNKIDDLEKIFFGEARSPRRRTRTAPADRPAMTIDGVTTETEYLADGGFWKTVVDLEIRNETAGVGEYATRFSLPEGGWISDFYLYVGDRKEKGILAEKRTALWVYRQITTARRDPGILYYLSGKDVGFRIFPFAALETRRAGFTVIHRAPADLHIGGQKIRLGREAPPVGDDTVVRSTRGQVHYVSPAAKARLERVKREPYYHFIVDLSEKGGEGRERSIEKIRNLIDRKLIPPGEDRLSLLNYRSRTRPLEVGWEETVRREPAVGGFYLERGMKEILVKHHEELGSRYPVIVIVSDTLKDALFTGDMESFGVTSPETEDLYHLDRRGNLVPYKLSGLRDSSSGNAVVSIPEQHVLAYPDPVNPAAYLRDNGKADIVLTGDNPDLLRGDGGGSVWEEALVLEGLWQWMQLHPEDTGRMWLPLVGRSFSSQILSPVTSFIALENEAQKQALLAKQKEVLRAKSFLDPGEETLTAMSEPPWRLMSVAALLLISLLRAGRRLRRTSAAVRAACS